jgi:hypothetical protein
MEQALAPSGEAPDAGGERASSRSVAALIARLEGRYRGLGPVACRPAYGRRNANCLG